MKTSEGYYRGTKEVCEHCREHELSDIEEVRGEGLCDRCWREINRENEIIGWRKGE